MSEVNEAIATREQSGLAEWTPQELQASVNTEKLMREIVVRYCESQMTARG